MEELRILREEMAAMRGTRRDLEASDVSEAEPEAEPEAKYETKEIAVRLWKAVIGASSKQRLEITAYNGGLNREELVDWINTMHKHFDFSEMPKYKKVKFAVTRLQGHALLWWDGVQVERRRLYKQPIKIWGRMVSRLRDKFLPKYYQLVFYK